MKGGHTPIHIQRWAPADYNGDEFVKILQARGDYLTEIFYRRFLDWSFLAGGDLPADLEALSATVHMPKKHVEKALAFCLGRLITQEGDRLYQRRVMREVKEELEFRKDQSNRGALGGRVAGKGRPKPGGIGDRQATAYQDDRQPLGPPSPDADAMRHAPSPDARAPEPPHPLTPNRADLEAECMRLVREVAVLRSCDPTEVMGEAGSWNGRRQLNPASMSIDRLMNTVLDLRRMREGKPAHAPPASNPRAQERKAGMVALIRGGLREGSSVGGRDGGTGRELPDAGPGPGGAGEEGRGLPPGTAEPER